MRTQGEIEGLTLTSEKAFADLEMRIMEDVVARLKANGASTATADWEISRLQQLGISERNINKWIAEALGVGQKEADRILSDEIYKEYNQHARAYKISGSKQIPFAENSELQSLIKAVTQQTHGTFQNITKSLGFATKGALGKIHVQQLRQFYTQTLDAAMMDIASGAFSYNTVLERTINTMTKSGLRSVDYATGHSNRIEVAVRRALMTGYGQIQRYNAEQVASELGTDYFEVSAHGGARPSHAEWQGKVYSRAELYSVCELDTATGLCGINCYHSYGPFIPGVSVRRYSDDDLDQIRKEDARQREYGGKSYNKYEALQHQRRLETTLRKYRRDVHLLEKGGADPDTILNKKIKYQLTYGQYKNFSQAMALPMQRGRIYQDGLKVSTYAKSIKIKVYDLHFKEKGSSKVYESLIKKARTETEKYYQVTGLHSDGHIFAERDAKGAILNTLSPKQLAKKIKSDYLFQNKPVKIYSCNAGAKDATAAQDLANALGVEVKAPTSEIALLGNGKFQVFQWTQSGKVKRVKAGEDWKIFKPKRN